MKYLFNKVGHVGNKIVHHSPDGMHFLYLVSAAGVWHEMHAIFAGTLAIMVAIELLKALLTGA